jgi:hypothetical protein
VTDVVRFAQELSKRGYSVYPVNVHLVDGTKAPEFKPTGLDGQYIGGWKNGDYPTDPDDIARHWEGYDGIAINTGRSGLVAVDIDVKKANGFDNLAGFLEANGLVLPWTPLVVTTQSGGEHRYYRSGNIPVKSLQNALGDGVDIRAVGGVAFAPPTQVGDAAYEFVGACPHISELPAFPDAVAERLAGRDRSPGGRTQSASTLTAADREFHTKRRAEALEQVSELKDGDRHSRMLTLANTVFGATAVMGESTNEFQELFLAAYEMSGGEDIADAESIVRDAVKYVEGNPWESTFAELTGEYPSFLPESMRTEFMDRVQRKELELAAADTVKERQRERTYSQTILVGPLSGTELLAEKPEEELWLVEGLLHWEKCRAKVIG